MPPGRARGVPDAVQRGGSARAGSSFARRSADAWTSVTSPAAPERQRANFRRSRHNAWPWRLIACDDRSAAASGGLDVPRAGAFRSPLRRLRGGASPRCPAAEAVQAAARTRDAKPSGPGATMQRCLCMLVTGPANAAKARVVLDGYRAALQARRGADPRRADVRRRRALPRASSRPTASCSARRSCASGGWSTRSRGAAACAGGRCARWPASASRTQPSRRRRCTRSPRRRARGGFARALLRLVDELEEQRVTPQRLTQALRAWADEDAGRRAYADEVAALYAPTAAGSSASAAATGRCTPPPRSTRCASDPAAWGDTPVFFYGFDDLTALQRDAVETLAATGAQVMLSLAYEPGRMAFAGRATTFAELLPRREHVALKPRAEHYAPASRAALHHLERELFELPADGPPVRARPGRRGRRRDAAAGRRRAGGARARRGGDRAPDRRGGLRAGGDRGRAARPRAGRGAARRGLRRARRAGRDRSPRPRSATPRSGAGSSRCCAARCWTAAPRTCSRGCARPACCAAPSSRTRSRSRRASEGARTAEAARALWERRALAARRDRPRAGRRPPRRGRAARALRRGARDAVRGAAAARRRGARRARGAGRRRARRRSRARSTSSRAIAAADRSLAPAAGGARRAARGPRGARRDAAGAGPRDGHRAAGAARAARARAVRLRPAGGRVPGRCPAPSRSSATPSASGSPPPRACACAAATTSAPSATSSTPRSRGPQERLYLSLARGLRRRRSGRARRSFSPTCAISSAPSLSERRRMRTLGEVGWRHGGSRRPRASGCAVAAAARARATARRRSRRSATRRSSASCATARPGRRPGSSCGPAAR